MRLGARIVIFVLFASIAPLVFIAYASAHVARSQVEAAILRSEIAVAEAVAGEIARQLDDTERVLTLQLANFRLDAAPDEARTAFLIATYRLFPDVSIALLLDTDGRDQVPPVYQSTAAPPELAGHERVSEARLARLRAELPVPLAPGRATPGAAYRPEAGGTGVVPVAILSPWDDGLVLGVELSLASVAGRMARLAGNDREIVVLSAGGEILVRAGGQTGIVEPTHFRAFGASAGVRYRSASEVDVLAACARVPDRDWIVAVAEPATRVAAATRAIGTRTAYIGGFAILLAVIAGRIFSRFITEPILRVRDAATAIGEGNLGRRVTERIGGELGQLAHAFNRMSASLERNADEIASQKREIEAFNLELQLRVEQRTAQLREAQSRLVQSGQLAAVAEMSAGLAHELNNPLAGILGLLQLCAARAAGRPEEGLLRAAEKEALRCKDIVANLLRFTRVRADAGERDVVDMERVVRDVLALVGGPFRQREVTVEHLPQLVPLHVRGDATLLGRALGQLLTSLRSVAATGSVLRIRGERVEDEVVYRFELESTTGDDDDWRAAGMGFWVARQVFQEHAATLEEPEGARGGPRSWRLRAPSEPGPPPAGA